MTDRAYLRVSFVKSKAGVKDESNGTLQKQRQFLRKRVAADHKSYVDENVSASKVPFADRPAGRRLLQDLRPGDRVLVTRIDRACRNVRDLLTLVEVIEERGATITFTEQGINTEGAYGKFTLTLLGALAELESGIISERRIESLALYKAEGRHGAGGIPLGLTTVPKAGGGRQMTIDPEMGPKVAAAVEAILGGATVASQAPALGITASSLSRLLRNKLLWECGVITYAQHERLLARNPGRKKTWSRTGGIGESLQCTCGGRLYFAKSPPSRPGRSSQYRCPSRLHTGPTRPTSIVAEVAEEQVERLFLARYGEMPVMEMRTVGDDEERARVVREARIRLEQAKARMDLADEEDEDDAYRAWKSAKHDLRLAEAIPTAWREEFVPTGQTIREAWEEADDAARVKLLRFPGGPWVVGPPSWAPERVREIRPGDDG